MLKSLFRKSHMEIGEPYFSTSTIYEWKHLLKEDSVKEILINSLKFLSDKKLISFYGFVIMPNHIHLLWQLEKMNGKEKPNASFQKYTSHIIQDILKIKEKEQWSQHQVNEYDREYRVWQRDPKASKIESTEEAEKVLEYIHTNPMQEHWPLVSRPEEYKYSSAKYYEKGIKDWDFIVDYRERW